MGWHPICVHACLAVRAECRSGLVVEKSLDGIWREPFHLYGTECWLDVQFHYIGIGAEGLGSNTLLGDL